MTERDPGQPSGEEPLTTGPGQPSEGAPSPAPTSPAGDVPVANSPAAAGERSAADSPGAPSPEPTAADAPTTAWTPPVDGPAAEPAPAPLMAAPARRRSGRARWAVAAIVTVLVVGIAAAAVVLLTGQSSPSSLAGYVPADSVAYIELRLDLPGDQRQKLGQFLSKFPGFADQANIEGKVNEVLDRLIRAATRDQHDYTTEIKPWFGGELSLSIGALPDTSPPAPEFHGLILVEVTDAAKARAWFEEIVDAPTVSGSHGGVTLTLIGEGSTKAAFGIDGNVMLLGDETSVNAAIDTNGASQFVSTEGYKAARQGFQGDSLGFAYLDTAGYVDWLAKAAQQSPGPALGFGFAFDAAYREMLPDWMATRIQARGDEIALEVIVPHVEAKTKHENTASLLAPHLPASTIAVVDGHEYGASLLEVIDLYRRNPETAEAFKQIDAAASVLGGFDAIFGWMDQAAIVLTRDGTSVNGGLVFRPTERAAAERFLTTLRGFAVLGGGSSGVDVRDETYNGATITIVDFGDLADLARRGGVPGMKLEGRFEIAYSVTDDVVILGVGPTFVRSVLDVKAGSSLADDARYKGLMDRVGAKNTSSAFLDLTAVRELVESLGSMEPAAFAAYERDVKPYLIPLDAYVQATTVGQLDRTNAIITVK